MRRPVPGLTDGPGVPGLAVLPLPRLLLRHPLGVEHPLSQMLRQHRAARSQPQRGERHRHPLQLVRRTRRMVQPEHRQIRRLPPLLRACGRPSDVAASRFDTE
ncbi:hypothetical protein ACFQ7Z_22015 [Streptomyces virginiae]|uniref:hypothetical protein n=1 Tax=Streptomyces virginiae TaxID=1961 RepID=UPI00369EEDCC